MSSSTKLIREIVDRKRDNFLPGNDGYIFIGKEEFGARYLTLRSMMMFDYFIKAYQLFMEYEMGTSKTLKTINQHFLRVLKRELESARLKDKDSPRLRYNGFSACTSSIPRYVPFYNSKEIRMESPAQTLNLFFRKIYGDVEEIFQLREAVHAFEQIIPFADTCDAKMQIIGQTFGRVVENFHRIVLFDACDFPLVCGVRVDIQNNSLLASMKGVLEGIMKAKIGTRPWEFEYVQELSDESYYVTQRTSLMFHITVLGENAFLGYYLDPEKTKYYRFNFVHENIMRYYPEVFEKGGADRFE